jgi:hypothetical protein
MKNRLKLSIVATIVALIITNLTLLLSKAEAGITPRSIPGTKIVYPNNYTIAVTALTKTVANQGEIVVGEMMEMSNDYLIVIPTSENIRTALILRISHENAFGIGDNLYMRPRLRAIGNQVVNTNTTFTVKSATTGSTGLREVRGEGKLQVSSSASTPMWCITYQETINGPWKTKITWGAGASPNNPGETLERSQLATPLGHPVNYGIKTEIVNRNGVPTLYVTSDYEGSYTLQASNNLTTWTDIGATITPIPALGVWRMGVFYEFNMVEPDPPPATENSPASPTKTRFFRYVMR